MPDLVGFGFERVLLEYVDVINLIVFLVCTSSEREIIYGCYLHVRGIRPWSTTPEESHQHDSINSLVYVG